MTSGFADGSEGSSLVPAPRGLAPEAYTAALDQALDGVLIIDDAQRYVYANPAACELLGTPHDRLIGMRPQDLRFRGTSSYAEFRGAGALRETFELHRADGRVLVLEGSGKANISPGLHLCILRDVTAAHEGAHALARAEARFRALLDRSNEAIALSDAAGTVLYVTASVEAMLGIPARDFVQTAGRRWMHPDDHARVGENLAALVATPDATRTLELRMFHADGSVRWVEATTRNLLADPAVGAMVTNFRDITARRQAAEALDESEARYRQVVEQSPKPIFIHDGGRVRYANPAAARMLGVLDAGTMRGRALAELLAPQATADLTAGPPTLHRFVHQATGAGVDVEVTSVELRFDGAPAILSFGRDVTQELAAERKLAEHRARAELERRTLQATLEALPVGVWISDPDGGLLHKNPAADVIFRGDAPLVENIDGYEAYTAYWPETGERVRNEDWSLARTLATGETIVAEALEIRRFDGSAGHVLNSTSLIHDAAGALLGGVVVMLDVTEQRAAERERERLLASLAREKQRADSLFRGMSVPTLVCERREPEGLVLTDVNLAAVALCGRPLVDQVGVRAEQVFADQPEIVALLATCSEARRPTHQEASLELGGTRRHVLVTCAPIGDIVLLHLDDRTAQRNLEQQLRQAQKMEAVGRLAGGVAHDFNNLLSVILSYSEMHLEELAPGSQLHEDLSEMHEAAMRGAGVARQLLAFSRKQLLQPQILDLNASVKSLGSMLRRLIGEDIELRLGLARDVGHVHADPGQIEQVLMNLVINARDAMPTGGTVVIETANVVFDDEYAARHVEIMPGQYVMLAVSDTGVGMDAATAAQVFDPFFTTKPAGKGTGLGLSTVFGIVHQSGGAIFVYSEPGVGTTFKIYLPLARGARTERTPVARTSAVQATETVLLVEDDEAVRKLAATMLRRAGYRVLEAAEGAVALELARKHDGPIDLLLTDVVMPRMSGRQVAEQMQGVRPMKVVYMSGYTDDAIIHHGVLESGVPFVQKPLTLDELLKTLRRVLA